MTAHRRICSMLVCLIAGWRLISGDAAACTVDKDCAAGSTCLMGTGVYGVCIGGRNPGNQNDSRPARFPTDLNRTLGVTCQIDLNCGSGYECLKGTGIAGTCLPRLKNGSESGTRHEPYLVWVGGGMGERLNLPKMVGALGKARADAAARTRREALERSLSDGVEATAATAPWYSTGQAMHDATLTVEPVVYMLSGGTIYHRPHGCDAFLGSGMRPMAVSTVPLVAEPCSFCYPIRATTARIEAETGLTIVYMKPRGTIYHRPHGCDAVVLDRNARPIDVSRIPRGSSRCSECFRHR